MKRVISYLISAAFLLSVLCGCEAHVHSYTETVIHPTCKTIGYTIHSCACGDAYYSAYQALSAHSFGSWQTGVEPTLTEGGEEHRICKVCGVLEARDMDNSAALPELYITSDGSFSYATDGLRFACKGDLQTVSDGMKRTYDLFLQNQAGAPYAVDLGWGEQAVYRLEPCLPDPSLARAAFAESLWNSSKAAGSNPNILPAEAYGGFPVQLFEDGGYLGVFWLTPHAGTWKYAYTGYHGSPTAALYATDSGDGCRFASLPSYGEGNDMEVLYCSTDDFSWATESFDGFTVFVREAKDAAFKEQLSQYTDTSVLIDYFLFRYLFGLAGGDTQGTVWLTADGIHWVPSFAFADLSTAFGITEKGALYSGEIGIPSAAYGNTAAYDGTNLLWARMCKLFAQEIAVRYEELRGEVLTADALTERFLETHRQIDTGLFLIEQSMHPSLPTVGMSSESLRKFLQERLDAMDAWLLYRG